MLRDRLDLFSVAFVTPIIKNHRIAYPLSPEVAGLTCCTPVFPLLLISFVAAMNQHGGRG